MDVERLRRFLLQLPHGEETLQWGENLVFWVGDKAIGGKMFALAPLGGPGGLVLSFHAGAAACGELLEREGVVPAPYFARIHWVALERWDALPARELEELLAAAHAAVFARLSKRTRETLCLPPQARRQAIAARRALLAGGSRRSTDKKRRDKDVSS